MSKSSEETKIRLVSNGKPGGTYILLEGGQVLTQVRSFKLHWKGAKYLPEATVKFCFNEIDISGKELKFSFRRFFRRVLITLARKLK
jgi:hypothetical protein